jgi:predicted RNA-binding protein YlxR (DUF448 family)
VPSQGIMTNQPFYIHKRNWIIGRGVWVAWQRKELRKKKIKAMLPQFLHTAINGLSEVGII